MNQPRKKIFISGLQEETLRTIRQIEERLQEFQQDGKYPRQTALALQTVLHLAGAWNGYAYENPDGFPSATVAGTAGRQLVEALTSRTKGSIAFSHAIQECDIIPRIKQEMAEDLKRCFGMSGIDLEQKRGR